MAGQRAAELSSPGAVQPAAGAGTPRSLRQELPTRSGQHQRGAACAPRQPPHLIPFHPIPSRETVRRLPKLPEVRMGSPASPRLSDRALPPPPLCPALPDPPRDAGSLTPLSPSTAETRERRDPVPATETGAAACGADAAAEGRAPAAAGCPFPSRAPGAAAALGSVRGALRGAPLAAPGAFPGQPRIFRNLPPGAAGTGPAARPEEPRWTEGRLQYVLFREALHHPP